MPILKTTVIFDLDGLMIDSERLTYEGYLAHLAARGLELDKDFYQTVLGNPMPEIERKFRGQYGEELPFKEIAANVHQFLRDTFETVGVPLKKGLLPLLGWLAEQHCDIGLATSSDRHRVDRILDIAGIEGYFDFVICGDEVTHGKPHPEVFLKCCGKIGCSPSQAIVLEDSEPGIQASYAAGITCIAVPDLKELEEKYVKMAYRVADSLEDALKVIQKNSDFVLRTRR